MAVQQNKKSPSRRGKKRSHHKLEVLHLSFDKNTGEFFRPHHISPNGMYNGIKVIKKD